MKNLIPKKQDILNSKWEDWELLCCSGQNLIYTGFELIGIYELYKGSFDGFINFYFDCLKEPKYMYRNLGINVIYQRIEQEANRGIRDRNFHISKRSMRRSGITRCGKRVKVFEGTFIMVNSIFEYLYENNELLELYLARIHKKDITQYLDFQDKCIVSYSNYTQNRRILYYLEMKQNLKKIILFEGKKNEQRD